MREETNIQALKSGNPAAIKEFAREGAGWVYNVIFSYVLNKEDAEEVTQDTILAALSNLDSFKNQSSLKTWTYRIAINKSKDFLKYKTRKKRHASIVSIDQKFDDRRKIEPVEKMHPGLKMEHDEDEQKLWLAINSLPEKQKTALLMAKLDRKPQAEIAKIMNTSLKAVESLISRAKSNLKRTIENTL